MVMGVHRLPLPGFTHFSPQAQPLWQTGSQAPLGPGEAEHSSSWRWHMLPSSLASRLGLFL